MKAIAFKNTKFDHPQLSPSLINTHKHGYAYESDSHFVYFFGNSEGFFGINGNMTATEGKTGTLQEWVTRIFGATDITEMVFDVGKSVEGVWQPCLYFPDILDSALSINYTEMRSSEQSLRLLVDQLDDIFLYIEPQGDCLNAYSHKTRQLLLLACTEVENAWKYYMKKAAASSIAAYYNTRDYVKLVDKLYLRRYRLKMKMYPSVPEITPFLNWRSADPSASLDWYDAYNKTKHDRDIHFSKASLWNCIQAVCAGIIMHCVRFGPFYMYEQGDTLSSITTQHFRIDFINPFTEQFYLFKLNIPKAYVNTFQAFGAYSAKMIAPFEVEPFTL